MPIVAAVQLEPSHIDPAAGLARIRDFAAQAAGKGAQIVVFPELLVPGYPRYVPDPFARSVEGRMAWADAQRYHRNYVAAAQVVPGPFTHALGDIARAHQVVLVVGVAERDPRVRGRLWNTGVVIDADGSYVGKHRKLVAVMHERLIFDKGGTEDILTFATAHANLGVCICFENHQPLYRRALGRLGEEIHCALWTGPVTHDLAQRGVHLEQHLPLGIAHALDTGTFVVIASQVTDKEPEAGDHGSQWSHSGGSYIVDPLGRLLASVPDWQEGIAVAELDLDLIETGRLVWNQLGDEARDDLFSNGIGSDPREPAAQATPSESANLGILGEPAAQATPSESARLGILGEPAAQAMPSEGANLGMPGEPAAPGFALPA